MIIKPKLFICNEIDKSHLISVKIWGNLADQLFQYGIGLILKDINACDIHYDYQEFYYFKRYQVVSETLARHFMINNKRILKFNLFFRSTIINLIFFNKKIPSFGLKLKKRRLLTKEIYYDKYRNYNLLYFSRHKILSFFNFKYLVITEYDLRILNLINNTESVGIHVCRADWFVQDKNTDLHLWPSYSTVEFYIKSLNDLKNRISNPTIFVFTDSILWCKKFFPELNDMTFIENFNENSLVSLQLLAECKHQILSPNNFGWWASWLNLNPSRNIYIQPVSDVSILFENNDRT